MTKLDFSLEVSDCLARDAREAGLLAPEALARPKRPGTAGDMELAAGDAEGAGPPGG